ncbi:MAG: glycosyltransferase family 4 protein [Actinomycetota bacterium]
MRILIAHSFYRVPGGEDRYVAQQVELLGDRHEVHLAQRRNEDLGKAAAIKVMLGSRSVRLSLEDEIRAFGPDVIHLHNAYPSFGPSVQNAARSTDTPLVMTVHNYRLRCPNGLTFTHDGNCVRCVGGAYYNAVIHRCFPTRDQSLAYASALWLHRFIFKVERSVNVFVCPSEFIQTRLIGWGIDPDRTALVRNFTSSPGSPNGSAGTYGAYVGRLSSEKGLDILLRALKIAGDPPFQIVGGGPTEDELKRLGEELGLENTHFVGFVDPTAVRKLVAEARYIAFPSVWNENAPLAALEAMTAARPLLVTRVGGLPELVQTGGGLACAPGDVEELAAGIRRLMDDQRLCETAGAQAAMMARSEFHPAVHLQRLEDVYERVRKPR